METSEQAFNSLEEFFKYCSEVTGKIINSRTLNRDYISRWDIEGMVNVININNNFNITFDSGGYSLIKI